MTESAGAASDNFAWACCGRWAADRARFALYCDDGAGPDSAWTFWDIQREANRFSNVLAALGVMRGERVALLTEQGAAAAALHVACCQMGAVAVPLPPHAEPEALAHALGAAETRVAVADASGQAALGAARAQAGAPRHAIGVAGARADWLRDWSALRPLASTRYAAQEDIGAEPALLLGAGTADAVELSHAELSRQAGAFLAAHPGYPQAGDLFWSPAAWTTRAGLLEGLLAVWCQGQPVVAAAGGFNAAAAFDLIARYDVRNVRLTPQELEAMMACTPKPNEKHDCRLRTVSTGGGGLPAAVANWLRAEQGVDASALA
jgi:acetyl-CoA synthetase